MLGKPHSALAVCFCFLVFLGSALPFDQRNDDLVQEVVSSLNRVLDFYHRDYKSINLDGIFGLRVAQGAFLSLINDAQDGQLSLDDRVLKQVKTLYDKASLVAEETLPYLQRETPDYFKKFKNQVSKPWGNFKPFTNRKLSKRHYDPQHRRNVISFDEDTSDHCMSELTGTVTSSKVSRPCQVSDRCWGLISAEGAEGYTLTHQALFLLLGEIQGCTPVLVKRLEQSYIKGGLEQIYHRICSDMYPQMAAIEHKRTLDQDSYDRDLYMEQAMVCGSIGYRDFLSSERLRRILTWQRKDGCFGEQKQVYQNDVGNQETDDSDQRSDMTDNSDSEAEKMDTPFGHIKKSLEYEYSKILRKPLSMRTMRSLLVEKELNDGCLSHFTGVATGLLGVYLRWLLYPQIEQPLHQEGKMKIRKPQDPDISKEREVYKNDDLADVIALKERQLQQRQTMQQDQLQSAHLRQMRKAAMLENSAEELLRREGSGSVSWSVIFFGSIFVIFSVVLFKGYKGMPNIVKAKKSSHVI